MRWTWCFVTLAALMASPAHAKPEPVPYPPATHPNWGELGERGIEIIKAQLFDPTSAQITWTSGFQWGFRKPLFGRSKWGWIACGSINAKNRLGGYVGAEGFLVFADASGGVSASLQREWQSTCDIGRTVPVPPEMKGVLAPPSASGPVVGVAEELEKLASLRDKGIITEAEFQTQKAKLLGR